MQLLSDHPMPVVLDTNVVLDWQLFRDPRALKLGRALDDGTLRWLATPSMLEELFDVLKRPLGPRWDPQRERILSDKTWLNVELIESRSSRHHGLHCADPDDQKFVDFALALGVRWLVTRDRALLRLRRGADPLGLAIVQPEHWTPSTPA